MKLTTLAVAALASLASASDVGKARIVNKCEEPVHVWSVGSEIEGPFELAPGKWYAEEFTKDPITGGKALKVTKDADGLYTGAPQTIFAYNLDNAGVWYDLSDVFGDAFAGNKLVVASKDPTCQAIVWPDGIPPAGSQVKVCTASEDVVFTICA
ncbi:hypothetical protein VTK26DRAFT_1233 [Humicola hyalothermophila]